MLSKEISLFTMRNILSPPMQNEQLLTDKAGGTYGYHLALKG
jgi:hypothetical protein